MKLLSYFILTVSLLFAYVGTASATNIVPSTLEYMTGNSDVVVIGQVVSQTSYWEAQQIFTDVRIAVDNYVKIPPDASPEPEITLKLLGGQVGDTHLKIDQAPTFTDGEKVMLFLKHVGDRYVPFGLSYGVYTITENAQQQEVIDGPLFHASEHYNLRTQTVHPNTELVGQHELATFVEQVKQLVKPEAPKNE